MIAADTSAWIDYFRGQDSPASQRLETALSNGSLVLPFHVLFEILSGPGLIKNAESALLQIPRLEIKAGYWERAAHMRKTLLKSGAKSRSVDCLIAQNCIDHAVALIAADNDFRHYIKFGLTLMEEIRSGKK